MKIILSTYNFYPVHKGGTEVYTKALAVYLRSIGKEVLIIAALDESNDVNGKVVADNEEIKATWYLYEDLAVLGIQLKKQTADDIYAGFRHAWTENFTHLLVQLNWQDGTHLIMNGISTVSGLSLCYAALQLSSSIKISIIVHTPFICPKADMIYFGTQHNRCEQVLSERTCASCLIAANTGMPFLMSRLFTSAVNKTAIHRIIKSTVFRLEDLLKMKFSGFGLLNEKAIKWIVFSNDMKQFMDRQLFITPGKINVIRHGIDKTIFYKNTSVRKQVPIIFLYAGRFETVKGINILSDAWQKLTDHPARRQLYLAGNWKKTITGRKIQKILSTRSDVVFMESLTQQELADIYRQVHAVIIPSRWVETGPLVFHEAIECGCDVITSNIGGQAELAGLYADKSFVFDLQKHESLYNILLRYSPTLSAGNQVPSSIETHFSSLCGQIEITG